MAAALIMAGAWRPDLEQILLVLDGHPCALILDRDARDELADGASGQVGCSKSGGDGAVATIANAASCISETQRQQRRIYLQFAEFEHHAQFAAARTELDRIRYLQRKERK